MISFIRKINSTYVKYILLSVDFVFVIASLMRSRINFPGEEYMLSISADGGYPEFFQYLKFAAIIVLLGISAISERSAAIGGWAAIFTILLLDDGLSIHEEGGAKLAEWFSIPPMFHLRSVDYGEMMIFATWGIISLVILALTYRTNRSVVARRLFRRLLLSLLGLAVFGGIVDMLHVAVQSIRDLSESGNNLFDAFEDGGEMVVISLALAFVYEMTLKVVGERLQSRRRALNNHPGTKQNI